MSSALRHFSLHDDSRSRYEDRHGGRLTQSIAGAAASTVIAAPAKAEDAETARLRDALERIALLDEADGHDLKVKHAFEAVGIASQALGKHPSEIFADRIARGVYKSR